jgi:hypothetical protein
MRNCIALFFLLLSISAKSQSLVAPSGDTKKESFRDRLILTGNAGASFGSYTYVQLSPMIGYKTTKRWINGVGVNFMYWQQRQQRAQSIYGGILWSRLSISQMIFLQSNFEILNREWYDPFRRYYRVNVPIWLVGGGVNLNGNGRSGVTAMVLWDVIGDSKSPYTNPLIRFGIQFGL